jgi:D-alanyl-D-alanine carboxypeptidase
MTIRNRAAARIVTAAAGALLVLVPTLPATAATGAQNAVRGKPAGESQLRQLTDSIVAAGAPGAAAVLDDGRGMQAAGSGLADLRPARPMRPDLTFRAGSVTKPMVATVVLQLVGEGKLSLSDTVERWLPGILSYGEQVTVRHLLTMSSGIPDYLRGQVIIDVHTTPTGRFRSYSPRELVALVAARPPNFAPGTALEYSNTNYVLAGLIVEAATGASLGHELSRRVFRPLRLRNTSFPVHNLTIAGRNARGYSLPVDPRTGPVETGDPQDFTLINPSFTWAAGNVVSDLDDLTRFLSALLRGRLLSPALLAEMKTPLDTGDPEVGYGLGLQVINTPCGPVIGHNGSIPGFHTMVLATDDGHRQFAVTVNEYFLSRTALHAFDQAVVALMRQLFPGRACGRSISK